MRYALDRGQWDIPWSLSFHQCPIPTSILILRLSNNKRGSPGTIKQSNPLSHVGVPIGLRSTSTYVLILQRCETCFCGISGLIGLENAWTLFAFFTSVELFLIIVVLLSYSMQRSPACEGNRFSASQIPCFLWNPKVHYRIHKWPPFVPVLSQLDPFQTPHPTSCTSILILSSHLRLGSCKWSLSVRFPHQNPVYASPLHHTRYISRPSHSSRFDHPDNIWWGVQIIKLLIMQFLHSPVTSSLLGPNILLSTLFSKTFSRRSFLNVSDQVSHPYKHEAKL